MPQTMDAAQHDYGVLKSCTTKETAGSDGPSSSKTSIVMGPCYTQNKLEY